MKIISLQAENIKKLVAIEIVPKGNMVVLKGKNGSGKTSVLDAISWAFEGLAKVQERPIRLGENKAWIKINLGEYIIERTFKLDEDGERTDSLKVMSADGAKFDSPQTLLNKLFGSLSFNPLEFKDADQKQQVTLLESLVKNFDFGKSRAEEEQAYNERTIVNRKAKESSLVHVSFKDVPVPEPEKVDVKALTNDLALAGEANTRRQKIMSDKDSSIDINTKGVNEADYQITGDENRIADMRQQIVDLEKHIELQRKQKTEFEAAKKSAQSIEIPKEVDASAIKAALDAAQTKNDLHERWVKRNKAKKEIEDFEIESAALTGKIADIQKARFNAVAGAGLPVDGLGFDATGVVLGDVPFSQASDAEQLRASIAIAMAANPTLRVIRVRDGSLLDEDGMALLAEMATKSDCQVWIERVTDSGKIGFTLEEGKIKNEQ